MQAISARLTAGILAAGLVLAACGREGETEDQTAENVGTGKISGEITVWAFGTEGEKLGAFAAGFEKAHPGVKVNVEAVAFDSAHDKLTKAIAAGTTPDVSMAGTTRMSEYAKTGALDPKPGNIIDASKFFDGALGSAKMKNTLYGVPWYVETRVLYYRTDLAAKAGVKPPTTWAETKSFARKLMDGAGAEHGIFQNPKMGSWQEVLPLIWQSGGDIVDSSGKWSFDTPEVVRALTYFQSFFKAGTAPSKIGPKDFPNNFVQGDVGAFYSGPWMISVLEDTAGKEFASKFDVVPYPRGSAGNTSFIGGSNLVVFKKTDNRDAAWKFVDWLTQAKVQADWFTTAKALPAVKAAWQLPALTADERITVFGEQLKTAKAPPPYPTWEAVAGKLETEIEKLALGEQTPEETAKAMQKQAATAGTGA